jgi:hypothetical protein
VGFICTAVLRLCFMWTRHLAGLSAAVLRVCAVSCRVMRCEGGQCGLFVRLFRLVLVDTPLAPYFSENLTHEDLDEMNIEVRGYGRCMFRMIGTRS